MTAEPCPTCGGTGQVTASWGELSHCQTCACTGRVVRLPNGDVRPVAPDSEAMHAELVGPELLPGLTARMVWDEHTATRSDGDG